MPKARASTRKRRRATSNDAGNRAVAVGRPLQARLIALACELGVFSDEPMFGADSRFNHPVILPGDSNLPPGMAEVFARELAALRRLGKESGRCHRATRGDYVLHALTYFHYDGFKALLYAERDGGLVAAWKEEEVLYPETPRDLVAGVDDAGLEAFLKAAEAR